MVKLLEKAKNSIEKALNVDIDGDGAVGKKKKKKDKKKEKYQTPEKFYQYQNQNNASVTQSYGNNGGNNYQYPNAAMAGNYQSYHLNSQQPQMNYAPNYSNNTPSAPTDEELNFTAANNANSNYNPYGPSMGSQQPPQFGNNVQEQDLVQIVVPQNAKPGQAIQIQAGDKNLYKITLPNNCYPGQTIHVKIPKANLGANSNVSNMNHNSGSTYPQAYNPNLPNVGFNNVNTYVPNPSSDGVFPDFYSFQIQRYAPVGLGLRPARYFSQVPQFIPASGRRKALLIGINYFGTKAQLNGCINDVGRMKNFLHSSPQNFTNTPTTFVTLTDDQTQNPTFLPTKQNIIKGIQWLVAGAKSGDVLFFHFSGHGAQRVDRSGVEKDGMNETICPMDFERSGMISDDELWEMLVSKLETGVKLTCLMDCCHSGTGLDLPYSFSPKKQTFKCEKNPCLAEADVVLISGCEDDECSLDSTYRHPENDYKKVAGGAMTTAFLQAYNANSTFVQFMSQLQQFLRNNFGTYGSLLIKQSPQLSSSQDFDPFNRRIDIACTGSSNNILLNREPRIGKVVRKHYHKKNKRLFQSGGIGEILMAGAAGLVIGSFLDDGLGGIGDVVSRVADLDLGGVGDFLGGLF